MFQKSIILASASPRRKELLEQAGLRFSIETREVDEAIGLEDPRRLVEEISHRKARPVMEAHPDCLVIGADTVVALDNVILGKPADEEDALRMLRALSGREHEVFTGVTIFPGDGGPAVTFFECTKVKMYESDEALLRRYIATGEPMDKAGSYGIQGMGAILVERIDGDYNNVVGLPLARLYRELLSLQ